jgi:hypothetical protein
LVKGVPIQTNGKGNTPHHIKENKMLSLKLFNAVLAKESKGGAYISEHGYIIEPNGMWAKHSIVQYYKRERLNGNDLNKTFHKSWAKIKGSSRFELFIEQIQHYISTYGSDFRDEIYIPDEILELPEVKLTYKVVKAYTKDELIEKCLSLLCSGIALKEETINNIITLLVDELGYTFTGSEGIKNKEAVVKIADLYGVLPTDTLEFFRYIIYRATGESLLIKSDNAIDAIKSSNYNPSVQFNRFGLDRLAEMFNRFKPLFLAFKNKCPKTINKISKLSKVHHKPLVTNPLNVATSSVIRDTHWLENATVYSLFKALSACYARLNGQDSFVYRIRNGKSWTAEASTNLGVCQENHSVIIDYLRKNYSLAGKKIFLPKDIKYGLPTSEKMFVGNIPTGTKFYGQKLAVGIYWKDSWGARDLDLSGLNIGGKVGWNASYNQGSGDLMYSGDITSAPNGAVEYLYANKGLLSPTLVNMNVFYGEADCSYKVIIGLGDDIDKNFMMNPNNLFADIKCDCVQKQMVLGIVVPEGTKQSFVLLNFGAGQARVSGDSELSQISTRALYQQWYSPLSFNWIVEVLGAEIVDSDFDYDFSLDSLERDSFMRVFEKQGSK